MNTKIIIVLFFYIAFRPLNALSQYTPDAHTHGEGRMTLVYENGLLLIEMKTPVSNMLSFEHQPVSETQWQALEDLKLILEQPQKLIVLAPDCQLKKNLVTLPFKRPLQDKPLDEKSRNKQEHTVHHEHHDEHEHHTIDDSKNKKHDVDHKDIYSQYEWQCDKRDFSTLILEYFKYYPRFEVIIVEWVISGAQGVTRMNKSNNIFGITNRNTLNYY